MMKDTEASQASQPPTGLERVGHDFATELYWKYSEDLLQNRLYSFGLNLSMSWCERIVKSGKWFLLLPFCLAARFYLWQFPQISFLLSLPAKTALLQIITIYNLGDFYSILADLLVSHILLFSPLSAYVTPISVCLPMLWALPLPEKWSLDSWSGRSQKTLWMLIK